MIPLKIIWLLLAIHWLADFVLQSDWMAVNKSSNWLALTTHVTVYTGTFFVWLCLLPVSNAFLFRFVAVTFATHFVTDALTSRLTAYLWQRLQRHWFFVTIGVDQLIHYTTLGATWVYLTQ